MARLSQAQLSLDSGQEPHGLQALTAAMALGREHGYVNSHVWIPAVMARLCARALEAGIEVDYVRGLVEKRRLVADDLLVTTEAWPWPIKIFTLGRFELLKAGRPIQFSRKVQRKPLALLKALIAFGGRGVREDLLMDALWPDAEGDAARVALASALHRLRVLMGHEQAIVRQEGQLSLDQRFCWVDVWAVEHLLRRAEAGQMESLRKAVDLYRGAFLDGYEVELPQATTLADTLRRRLLREIVRAARSCAENDRQQSVDWYEHALRVDPCAEDVYSKPHEGVPRARPLGRGGRELSALPRRPGRPPWHQPFVGNRSSSQSPAPSLTARHPPGPKPLPRPPAVGRLLFRIRTRSVIGRRYGAPA